MAPPELTANAPVADIGEPVAIHLLPAVWQEARILMGERLPTTGSQRLRFHKPLGGEQRLHRHLAPLRMGNTVAVLLHLHQQSFRFKSSNNSLPRFKTI